MKKTAAFEKTQWMESKTFGFSKDLIDAVLEDGRDYTKEQAEGVLQEYLTRKEEV